MNTKDLIRLGVPVGEPTQLAHEFIQSSLRRAMMVRCRLDGLEALSLPKGLRPRFSNLVANPPACFADELRAPLARAIYRPH